MARLLAFLIALVLWGGAPPAQADPVRIDYMLNCQGCHLPGGEGFPERGVPQMRGEIGKFLTVEGGRAYLVQVPGVAFSDLPDDHLARVLNWVLTDFSSAELPEDFKPYTAEEVSDLRKSPLIEVAPVRAALIARIRAAEGDRQEPFPNGVNQKRQSDDQ